MDYIRLRNQYVHGNVFSFYIQIKIMIFVKSFECRSDIISEMGFMIKNNHLITFREEK